MSYKIFVEQIKEYVPGSMMEIDKEEKEMPNLNLRIKCLDTQDEYKGQVFLNL
jgi:hypothetical protein